MLQRFEERKWFSYVGIKQVRNIAKLQCRTTNLTRQLSVCSGVLVQDSDWLVRIGNASGESSCFFTRLYSKHHTFPRIDSIALSTRLKKLLGSRVTTLGYNMDLKILGYPRGIKPGRLSFASLTPRADKLFNFRRSRLVLRKSHSKLPPRCPISWDRVHPVHRRRSHRVQNSLLSGTLAGQLAHSHLHTEIESEKIGSFKKSFTVKCC